MRLSRIVKLISFTEKLVLLVESFVAGLSQAIWVLVLLILAIYVFAVLSVELFGSGGSLQTDLTAAGAEVNLDRYFGTIPRAVVTLIQLYSDDGSVSEIMRPMGEAHNPNPNPNPNWPIETTIMKMAKKIQITLIGRRGP